MESKNSNTRTRRKGIEKESYCTDDAYNEAHRRGDERKEKEWNRTKTTINAH